MTSSAVQLAGFMVAYATAILITPPDRVGRGRLLSRWLRIRNPLLLRLTQILVLCVIRSALVEPFVGAAAGRPFFWTFATALFLDDYFTGGDDDPWWKRAWGKVRLKMPAPVRLRPVERLTPCIESTIQWRG